MDTQIIIRRVQEHDAEAIGRLWFKLSLHHEPFHTYYAVNRDSESYLINHVKELLRRDCVGFVAEKQGEIVGFVTGYVVRRNPQLEVERVGKVDNIYVAEGFRGLQVGSSLLERLSSCFKEQGIRFIEISCDIQNQDALRLYKRLGFHEQKVMLIKEV